MAAQNRFTIQRKVPDVAASNGNPSDANSKDFQVKMQPTQSATFGFMKEHDLPVIDRLLQRMESSPGFAGLGASVQTITRLTNSDDAETREIAAVILRDAALTGKLLRIANSSRYGQGGRNISTINQAIAILGLKTVKSVALSLALLDALSNKPQSRQLQAEIVAAYFCGALSFEITRLNAPRFNAQEAQVCGLLQNLGRMMALYYLYDDIERIRGLQIGKNMAEEAAAAEVMGTGFAEISAAIAQHWSLPEVLQESLAPIIGEEPPPVPATALGWNQCCTSFARRTMDSVFRLPEEQGRIELARAIDFFRGALSLKESEVHEWMIDKVLEETGVLLEEMSFPCRVEDARKLLCEANGRVRDATAEQEAPAQGGDELAKKTQAETTQQVLRLIHDEYGFDLTLLCLPDGTSELRAIAGVGRDADQISSAFHCRGAAPDIFRLVTAKQADMYIADAKSPSVARFIPNWYLEEVGARSFLLASLVSEGQCLGLLYGGYAEARPALVKQNLKEWRERLTKALVNNNVAENQ